MERKIEAYELRLKWSAYGNPTAFDKLIVP